MFVPEDSVHMRPFLYFPLHFAVDLKTSKNCRQSEVSRTQLASISTVGLLGTYAACRGIASFPRPYPKTGVLFSHMAKG